MKLQNTIQELCNEQHLFTSRWHENTDRLLIKDGLASFVLNQHLSNFNLWHLEDEARALAVSDSVIADIKRKIDKVNQQRNNQIESVDEYLISVLPISQSSKLNSETPGSIFDRLSINSLKIFHMEEQDSRMDVAQAHRDACREKVALLKEQRNDLIGCLHELIGDLESGSKRLKVYRQVKMYNDPALNPVLYGAKNR